ncbi:MAG: DNA polymerase II large subunit [Candidatus Woesearchaeota archaeon]
MTAESKQMQHYFKSVQTQIDKEYALAQQARQQGFDPEKKVDIPLARNMAERVQGLISMVAPQLVGSGMIERLSELEKKFGILDWRVALVIAEEVAKQKFCRFKSEIEAVEVGIRTGFAYHTLGIVSAPLEGFIGAQLKKRKDGKQYLSVRYAGPVRGAGGTAAAFSVIIADYVRKKMGYSPYDPTEEEIKRYVTEIEDYHEKIANLQYFPSREEIEFLTSHIPVEINGDPTEQRDVSQHKDLPRVETNLIRGGICLVIAEGLAQKAKKIWKRLEVWGGDFDLEWQFLSEFLNLQKNVKAQTKQQETTAKLTPNYTYIHDLVAGRPVLTHPLRIGGFRLRYGRTRVNGYSSASIHPVTQLVLDRFIAIGTQLKVERPGKAAAITVCDSIDGPIVKLADGSVHSLSTAKDYNACKHQIKNILYLGDILFNYGDFSENNHLLVPCGYCEEWWILELEKYIVDTFGALDWEKFCGFIDISPAELKPLLLYSTKKINADISIKIAQSTGLPLHPHYTYFWNSITGKDIISLVEWFSRLKVIKEEGVVQKLVLPIELDKKQILERLGLPHLVIANEFVVVEKDHALVLTTCLGLNKRTLDATKQILQNAQDKTGLETINQVSSIKLRDKGGTFIGARMGRPEKAKMRTLTGSPHVLFPVGEEGGRLRSFQAAIETGKVKADFPLYFCQKCNIETIFPLCEVCGGQTQKKFMCATCGTIAEPVCATHGPAKSYSNRQINIAYYFESAVNKLKFKAYPDLIKGVRGTSNKDHIPEQLVKGILRAKHNVFVNKDGTTRYDMSELAITHFKPREIGTSIQKLQKMGYENDIEGKPLENEDQILEIKPQDIILPGNKNTPDEAADTVLLRVTHFVDELLVRLYGLKPYYNLKSEEELVGQLFIGLAPHISAGTVGRLIGFSQAQACYAHPLWHASLRRDCDGDECCVILLMDALLNFSRQYLPDKRGGRTMDAPLVLTAKLIPSEVDDMAHGLDVVWNYPLALYEAAAQFKHPSEIKIEQIHDYLDTPRQYESMGFTHSVTDINKGVRCSAYKILPTMEEKLKGQMALAEKIMAVDQRDVASLIIEKHFIKDIKGNLRKFSMQQFRCVSCNQKFRRPPLAGKCTQCGGKIIFTISLGSIVKYLEPSISLAEKYDVTPYLKQTLELTKRRVEEVFGRDKEKQEGLGKWFC